MRISSSFFPTLVLLLAGGFWLITLLPVSAQSSARKKEKTPLEALFSGDESEPEPKKKKAPPRTIPPRTSGFSFNGASRGKVSDFAHGESPAEIKERHQASMLRKYDRNGDGKLDDREKARQMQDHYVHHKRLIHQYDKNGNKKLDRFEAEQMAYLIYFQRLSFMNLYDEDQDGYLDGEETRRMRSELDRRQELFLKNMSR